MEYFIMSNKDKLENICLVREYLRLRDFGGKFMIDIKSFLEFE